MHRLSIKSLICFTLLFCSCSNAQETENRTWTDSSGEFSVEASMVLNPEDSVTDDVTLKKNDGSTVTVDYDVLSKDCQAFVRKSRRDAKRMKSSGKSNSSGSRGEDDGELVWNWRGPNQDGISSETGLLAEWPDDGPELLWSSRGLGDAMSSVAIGGGKIFTMGNIGGDHLIALDLKSGEQLWATRVGSGASNSTPTVDGDYVYALGIKGDLICCEVESGKKVWSKSFERDFGGKMMSEWGYSESPLVDGDLLICTPGGEQAMIVALNKRTGETVWKTPMRYGGNRGVDGAGYSTIVVSNGGGVKQYITLVGRGLISVAAEDGKPLWHYEKIANGTANIPTPIVDGDYVFCSSGYGDGGTALLKLSGRRGQVGYDEIYYMRGSQLQNHHGGMIKIGDYVYMGEGHNEGFPMCVNFRTGQKMWQKQRGAGTGSAAIVAADGHLYFRYQNGIMALIEANPNSYRLKSKFRIATVNGQSWPHPVIYNGQLFLRDKDNLHCYKIN